MLLGLEIALTIAAWKRGWRGRALLPLLGGITVGVLIGFVTGATGGMSAVEGAMAVATLLDVVCVGVLIGMVVRPRRATA